MFKNRLSCGNNICGKVIYNLRKQKGTALSQRKLADLLQLEGLDLDKNAIQRIECGKRFVIDIELAALAKIFDVTTDYLLGLED